jgi:hypothetical protein
LLREAIESAELLNSARKFRLLLRQNTPELSSEGEGADRISLSASCDFSFLCVNVRSDDDIDGNFPMKTQTPMTDRRQYSREGVVGEIENLAYTLLRKYGIPGHADQYDTAEDTAAA